MLLKSWQERVGLLCLCFLLVCLLFSYGIQNSAATQKGQHQGSEHPRVHRTGVALEPKFYWFYEALGKLENVKETDNRIEGSYESRFERTDFWVEKKRVMDPAARTEGYKLAIEKIISYMAPGALPDNEANRKYMTQLMTKLREITGMDLKGYPEWKKWFEENRDRLEWSDEKKMIVVEGKK